jgi:hypothetical protein
MFETKFKITEFMELHVRVISSESLLLWYMHENVHRFQIPVTSHSQSSITPLPSSVPEEMNL